MKFWIGGWGPAQGGESEGISLVTAGEAESPLAGGMLADRGLAARAESPSWLAAHPAHGIVYAALEADGRHFTVPCCIYVSSCVDIIHVLLL